MDIHASDPILVAGQQYRRPAGTSSWLVGQSADIIELCRIFLLNLYLKHFGRGRLFELLQREHERHNPATGRAFVMLIVCFLITGLLQADLLARWLAVAGSLFD